MKSTSLQVKVRKWRNEFLTIKLFLLRFILVMGQTGSDDTSMPIRLKVEWQRLVEPIKDC